jgi:hypothetical protein
MPDKSQVSFAGFELPEQNWFRLPNSWTDITRDITTLGELKVVEYVLRHTWGYHEFGTPKRISTDEFMNGRRHQDGSRMDRGTGLAKQSVIDGLRKAVDHGFLIEHVDKSDKGRVKKYYSLRMRSRGAEVGGLEPHNAPSGSSPNTPVQNLDPDVQNLDRGVKNLDPRGKESRHRSEKETIERNLTVTVNGNGADDATTNDDDRHPVAKLPTLNQPPEQTELLAHDIAVELGDSGSIPFYFLVAARVPEATIRQHLSEIKLNGAENPARLFNYRMRRYVESRLAKTQSAALAKRKEGMFDQPFVTSS